MKGFWNDKRGITAPDILVFIFAGVCVWQAIQYGKIGANLTELTGWCIAGSAAQYGAARIGENMPRIRREEKHYYPQPRASEGRDTNKDATI